jgi:hypothetical protein
MMPMMPPMMGGMPPMLPMIPMGMPKMPMPMPEMPSQKATGDDRKCPDGSPKPLFGTCPKMDTNGDGKIDEKDEAASAQTNAASDKLMGFFKNLPGTLGSLFGTSGSGGAGGENVNTYEGQLDAIANSANPDSTANAAVKTYIEGLKDSGASPLNEKQFYSLMVAAEANPDSFAVNVCDKYPSWCETNDLHPVYVEGGAGFSGGSGGNWITNISNTISSWVRNLF